MRSEPDLAATREIFQRVEECSTRGRMRGLVLILAQQGPDAALAEWTRRQNAAADEAIARGDVPLPVAG